MRGEQIDLIQKPLPDGGVTLTMIVSPEAMRRVGRAPGDRLSITQSARIFLVAAEQMIAYAADEASTVVVDQSQ